MSRMGYQNRSSRCGNAAVLVCLMTMDKSNVPISLVIPSYRAANTVVRAVQSALEQNGGNIFVIVVVDDDCPVTRSLLLELDDRRLTVISNPVSLGSAASRNRGLKLVTTRYVSFLDSDDYFVGDLIGPLSSAMIEIEADVGFGPSIDWNPRRGYCNFRLPTYTNHEQTFMAWLRDRNNVNTASVLWATGYLRRVGSWDESIHRNQDGELALRAVLLGARFVTSREGRGVWWNDRSLNRITTRTDNFGSLLDVAAKFLSMRSDVVSDQLRREACAHYYLRIAHVAFSAGQDDVGTAALERRRALGFGGFRGRWSDVLSATLRLVPQRQRLIFWRVARNLRNLVSG